MTGEAFAQQNPAYAVLYTPDGDNRWLARVPDIPECEARGHGDALAKAAPAYAVLYSLEQDGRWRATVLDIPGCEARGKDVGVAKVAANQKLKTMLAKYRKKGLSAPLPLTRCHYIRPNSPHSLVGQQTATAAITEVVRAYRETHGTLPPAATVCGYVNPEVKEEDEDI